MAERNLRVGNIRDVRGELTIAGGDIYKGYTAEQVSVLLTQITSSFKPRPFDGRCPYKGLEVFEEEDAELFFGRERLVADLLGRVKESRAVFITGPSGSGKSSLVRAGLLHSLKKGALKGSERWLYETMKPGREPLKDLALAFSRLKSPELANYFQAHANEVGVLHDCAESALSTRKDQRLVLFVDQFEEVFTQVNNEQERLAFLNMLAHAGTVENGRVLVLFAMRSDFVSNCATYPMLNELLSQEFRQIGAMQPEELVSAIALPARHVGLPIEDELIARIINDMKGEPGALPLMQFALKDLFDSQRAQGGVIALTLSDYLQHGGIHRSLERHADHTFRALSETEQTLAQSLFSGLIQVGRGTEDTRRTPFFDELVPVGVRAEEVRAVVQKLADARLVITDEQDGRDTVTISHEKLIDAWPWLRKLVNENREAIALQNQIAEDAAEWQNNRGDASYLYTGARLANAREQLTARKLRLSEPVQAFVEAGIAIEEERHQREEARLQRELEDSRQLAESMAARLRAERRARRGLQVLAGTFALLALIAFALLARPYVLRYMAQGDMAFIPAGPAVIGSDDPEADEKESPAWKTALGAFYIDRYEVSNYRYGLCVEAATCSEPRDPTHLHNDQYADYPVVGVTAFQADRFCRWLGRRLPSELEWERAARGPDGRDWPWGYAQTSPERANLTYGVTQSLGTQRVDALLPGASPQPEQVFNLIGNAWEWTSSYRYDYEGYDQSIFWDSRVGGPEYGLVQRGGAWNDNTLLRVTRRDSVDASEDTRQVGIRCADNP